MIMIRRILGLCVIALIFLPAPAMAQNTKGFWRDVVEFFYPSLRTPEANPYETLRAPFADSLETEAYPLVLTVDEAVEVTSYKEPHRLSGDIGRWLTVVLSETMTFDSLDYQDDLNETEKYFDTNGRALYLQFLEEHKFPKILQSHNFYVRSFVRDAPLLLNEGLVGEHYRWLFDVPVLVTYMNREMTDYRKGDVTTQEFSLRIQLARSPAAKMNGVVIDQWEGKAGKVVRPKK